MNQNQCVPNWDLDDEAPLAPPPPPAPPPHVITSPSHTTSISTGLDNSLSDYEVAELTWKNGQLAMQALNLPRVSTKSNLLPPWPQKPSTGTTGTLESIVNQAITKPQKPPPFHVSTSDKDTLIVPCFDQSAGGGGAVSAGPIGSRSVTMDALVPTANGSQNNNNTFVGSCSAAAARVPVGSEWSVSLSGSNRRRERRFKREREDKCHIVDGELTFGLTSTSFGTSPENTTTKTVTVDDYDSVCHTLPQGGRMEEEEHGNTKASAKSSLSTKRSRAAAIHNQSERKRRDKINQRMKTLQKLVPNSNKTDKASMLDEVIDYLKQLQAQVQMMSRMSMPTSMMMPMAAIQQLQQMSMMSQLGMAGMGMAMPGIAAMGMDPIINPMALPRTSITTHGNTAANNNNNTATILNPTSFMASPLAAWDCPNTAAACAGAGVDGDRLASTSQQHAMVAVDPFSAAFLACQSQPMTIDTYSRMAAMYQQLQQLQPPPGP